MISEEDKEILFDLLMVKDIVSPDGSKHPCVTVVNVDDYEKVMVIIRKYSVAEIMDFHFEFIEKVHGDGS